MDADLLPSRSTLGWDSCGQSWCCSVVRHSPAIKHTPPKTIPPIGSPLNFSWFPKQPLSWNKICWKTTPAAGCRFKQRTISSYHAVGIGGSLAIFGHQIPCRDHLHHQIPRHHQSSSRVSATPKKKEKKKKKKKKKSTRERVGGRGNIEREGPAGDKKKQRDPILNRISPNEEEEAASRRTTDLVAGPFYRAF